MAPHVLRYTEGDTLPLLRVFASKADGTAPSYADYTIKLRITRSAGPALEKTAGLIDATTGEFIFVWSPSDHVRGKHWGAVVLLDADGRRLTSRQVLFDVDAPIE